MKATGCSHLKAFLGKLWQALRAAPTTQQCPLSSYGCSAFAVPDLLAYVPEAIPCLSPTPEAFPGQVGPATPRACRLAPTEASPTIRGLNACLDVPMLQPDLPKPDDYAEAGRRSEST